MSLPRHLLSNQAQLGDNGVAKLSNPYCGHPLAVRSNLLRQDLGQAPQSTYCPGATVSKKKKTRLDVQLNPNQNQHEAADRVPGDVFAQVRARAYEIFAERGYRPGHALDDWLLAEEQMLGSRIGTLVESWTK
jgi:hypothetical protein